MTCQFPPYNLRMHKQRNGLLALNDKQFILIYIPNFVISLYCNDSLSDLFKQSHQVHRNNYSDYSANLFQISVGLQK